MKITPAILPYSYRELEEKLALLKGATDFVQIDITDGKFAGKASWPVNKPDQNFEAIVNQEKGLPFWEDFDFEIDLMCQNPFSLANDFISAGVSKIIFHADTLSLSEDALLLDQLKTEGVVEIGIACTADTDEEHLKDFLKYADFVQVMSIKKIGFQGEPFYEKCLEKISWVRQELPHIEISVDGAMNPETAQLVKNAGATRVVAGSFVLESTNPIEAVKEFEDLL